MKLNLRVKGTQDVVRALRSIEKAAQETARDEVTATVYLIEAAAKRDAPVDLGYLRQSGFSEVAPDGLSGSVTFSAPYAPFQEFGTGGEVDIPPGWEPLAAQFRGKRRVDMKPQPFLIPNAEAEVKELFNRLKTGLAKLKWR